MRSARVKATPTRTASSKCAVMVGVLFGMLLLATTARARDVERVDYSGTFSGEETTCGHDLHFEGAYHGHLLRKTRDSEPVAYYQNKFFVREVFRDAEGNGYIIEENNLSKDVRIRHVAGSLYRSTAILVGQAQTFSTLAGRVVERNVGQLRFSFLIDTMGDADPSNDEVIEETLLKDAGMHPEVYSTDEEFCAMIEEAMAG